MDKLNNHLSHVDVINFLRDIATLFVFLTHGREYVGGLDNSSFVGRWLQFPAWGGVWIFFFLSGFLFGSGMLKSRYQIITAQHKLDWAGLADYYKSRFLRLAPLYYLYLLLFDLFRQGEWLFGNTTTAFKAILFLFNGEGGIGGIGHLWYISVAVQLYLVMPLIYYLLHKLLNDRPQRVRLYFFAVCFLGLAWRLTAKRLGIPWYRWVYTFFASNLDIVICGMLSAHLVQQFHGAVSKGRKTFSALLFAALILYNIYVSVQGDLETYQYLLPSVYVLACTCLICGFQSDYAKSGGLINGFSKYTYAFYVFHIVSFLLAATLLSKLTWIQQAGITVRYLIFFILAFLVTLLFSWVFTKYFRFSLNRRRGENAN